jgi:hyperosmotically inducible periplasmic protein
MKITKISLAAALMIAVAFTSCKPKDADIQAGVVTALKADPKAATTKVEVKDGVVTLSGECADADCKANCEKLAAAVKGVKPPVVNNCTVTPPPAPVAAPASTTTVMDAKVMQTIKDGLKDIKGVAVDFASGKPVLSGEVSAADRMKIMQMQSSAKVMFDVTKLMTKK